MALRIRLTRHARAKLAERNIPLDAVISVVSQPETRKKDRFDSSLEHFIGKVGIGFQGYKKMEGKGSDDKNQL